MSATNGEKKVLWWLVGLTVPALMAGSVWAFSDLRSDYLTHKDANAASVAALQRDVAVLTSDVAAIKTILAKKQTTDAESRKLLRAVAKKLRVDIPDKE